MSYVKASHQLPRLSVEDMESLAVQYGLSDPLSRKEADLEKSSFNEHIEATA